MTISKNTKMNQFLNHRMRVQLQDNRFLIGTMKGFDQHMNLVLADCEETRRVRGRDEKRIIGFILLRGEHIVSLSVEGPPPNEDDRTLPPQMAVPSAVPGIGMGRAVGRGLPTPAVPIGPPRFWARPTRLTFTWCSRGLSICKYPNRWNSTWSIDSPTQ